MYKIITGNYLTQWEVFMYKYLKIVNVKGREVMDSRGNPTVEAEVTVKALGMPEKYIQDVPLFHQEHLQVYLRRWN